MSTWNAVQAAALGARASVSLHDRAKSDLKTHDINATALPGAIRDGDATRLAAVVVVEAVSELVAVALAVV